MINAEHVKFFSMVYVGLVGIIAKMYTGSIFGAVLYTAIGALVPVVLFVLLLVAFAGTMLLWSNLYYPEKNVDMKKYITFNDKEMEAKYSNVSMPMYYVYEAYMAKKIDFNMDFYTMMNEHRFNIFRMCFTIENLSFFFNKLMPQAFSHTENMDHGEIAHVYDRGNDFYNWFLGPSMVYTSGIFESADETLEAAQDRKLDKICKLLQLRKDKEMEMLDIGCGWGTLSCHAAEKFGARVFGITLAQEQVKWGMKQAEDRGVVDKVDLQVCDYRLLPFKQYDAISCVEMSEHVGIWKYQQFLSIVKERLKPDGLFYLQIAGLRRAWQFEDLIWGIFMGTYIFPAADASCPLGWVVSQLEYAGFEVRSVDTIGIQYSWTIKRWYDNWLSNRDAVVAKYGEWWFRLWVVFLAWSTLIAAEGGSTCYQIIAHRNKNDFDRTRFIGSIRN